MTRELGQSLSPSAASGRQEADGLTVLFLATELARDGKYEEADILLETVLGDGTLRGRALGVRACMMAQQGRYVEAEACWLEALRRDPSNKAYRKGLDAITQERCPLAKWVHLTVVVMVSAATSLVCLFALLFLLRYLGML